MAICEELTSWQIDLDMDELSISLETAATIISESPELSTAVFPGGVVPSQKRKSDNLCKFVNETRYRDAFEMYHLSVHKLLNPPISSRRTELPLHRSVRIRNVLKQLEHDISFSNYHSEPPSKRIGLDGAAIEEDYSESSIIEPVSSDNINTLPCTNSSHSLPNPLLTYKDSVDQNNSSLPSPISSCQAKLDTEFSDIENDGLKTDYTGSVTFTRETEYRSLSRCSYDHQLHRSLSRCSYDHQFHRSLSRCSYDHQLHSANKENSHSMEDLDTIMQVLVGI